MKCGIEIHRRLATNKLFCNCPSMLVDPNTEPDTTITRRLHPVLSELGEVDRASKAEFMRSKQFCYLAYSQDNCLVETDEEPPHPLNPEALDIVLQISAQLKATPVDEMHIMRKIVIDGSNTSGFQRTAIVALDGRLETSRGEIGIPLIAVEEESAGIVETRTQDTKHGTPDTGHGTQDTATFRLDRLGIPLIEISTTPDIQDGEHLREVAEKLGMILRATGRVARGLGTIRQDVNISTERGARVEIKGAQDLKLLPVIAENEVRRQERLVYIIDEIKKRFNGKWKLKAEPVDVSGLFDKTDSPIISKGLKSGSGAFALLLKNHAGLLGLELQPNRRYGSELSDYAKKAGVRGIIHSDEDLGKYKISESESSSIRKTLDAKPQDAFVLVIAPKGQANAALSNVLSRANMDHVPEETRKLNPAGTSSYMRPLPGRARMYPETDVPPIIITQKMMDAASKHETLDAKAGRLSKLLNPEMAKRMLKSRNLSLFERLVEKGADPMLAATTLEDTLVSLRREGVIVKNLELVLPDLFAAYSYGKFVKAAIPVILKKVAEGKPLSSVVKDFTPLSAGEVKQIVSAFKGDMKQIMAKYRTRIDPKELQKLLKKR